MFGAIERFTNALIDDHLGVPSNFEELGELSDDQSCLFGQQKGQDQTGTRFGLAVR